MLKINRLKIEIETINGQMVFNESFKELVNIVCSENNTTGKSSIISAIYYALGLEEIIGGRGAKVLTPVFKNSIIEGNNSLDVLESKIFLEIFNGTETITIYRTAKSISRKENLITVYKDSLNNINVSNSEDMYVHLKNAATNEKGFHHYLTQFLNLQLPSVATNDDKERQLYIQLIFSCLFIEQKRGWSDLFSGMPHFGIKEPKKRVIEFILNLDVHKNENLKHQLRTTYKSITSEWSSVFNNFERELKQLNLISLNFKNEIQILEDNFQIEVAYIENDVPIPLIQYLENLESEIQILNKPQLNKIENFKEANSELIETEKSILQIENDIKIIRNELNLEKSALTSLTESLELIEKDIKNNEDALKLKKLGSIEDINTFKEICPVCYQNIADSALISQNNLLSMSIEENINHLKSHKSLFQYSIIQKEEKISILNDDITHSEASLEKLRLLQKFIRNDLYSLNNTYSEQSVYKLVQYQKTLSELNLFKNKIDDYSKEFLNISLEWKMYLSALEQLPKQNLSESDLEKLKSLRNFFISNLGLFGYKSRYNLDDVYISRETYLPAIEMFDLKFDSSASDNIRAIWAYTIALLQTSNLYNGNHPGIIILDEPGQHSTIIDDVAALFSEVRKLPLTNQIIIGITMKDSDTKHLIKNEINAGCNEILITDRAIKPTNTP